MPLLRLGVGAGRLAGALLLGLMFGASTTAAAATNGTGLLAFSCAPSRLSWSTNDTWGTFFVSANTSDTNGQRYNSTVYVQSPGYLDLNMTYDQYLPFTDLIVDITLVESGDRLVVGRNVSFNNLTAFAFPLDSLSPREKPYEVNCYAASIDGQQVWNDTASFSIAGPSRSKQKRSVQRSSLQEHSEKQSLERRTQIGGYDVWCGKPYRKGSPYIEVDGQFPVPTVGDIPLLHLGCKPRIQPYLADEANGSFVLSTDVRYDVGVPVDITSMTGVEVRVSVSEQNVSLLTATVSFNETHDVPFSLSSLSPKSTPYNFTCEAVIQNGSTVLTTISEELWVLPQNPYGGSTTKMDRLTGALLVNTSGTYSPLFGTGFYAGFSWWLSLDVANIMQELASYGFNIIHPVGTNTNDTAMDLILRSAEDLGIWVIPGLSTNADLSAQNNNTYLTAQIEQWRGYKSLLFWYTFDEPDGQTIAQNASVLAKEAVRTVDQLYHPVGTVLNCENYFFSEYAAGADIISHDVYQVADNATWSVQYDTECNAEYGCCGCDNCEGKFEDISNRLDSFRDRLVWSGATKMLWSVPQAFGSETFWARYPTADEIKVQYALSVNHGAKGLESWDAPSTPTIFQSAGQFATRFTEQKDYIFGTQLTGVSTNSSRVDVGAFTKDLPVTTAGGVAPESVLLIVVNMNIGPVDANIELGGLAGSGRSSAADVYDGREVSIAGSQVAVSIEGLGVAFVEIQL